MRDHIAVLVPCYNEEKTVQKVVTDFRNALPEAVIYVYDNNSKDRTAELAGKAGAIVRKETAQGKGNVIRRMFREIEADCYIMVDGDDTYPAEHAREMCDAVLAEDVDMVIGDRLSTTYYTENKRAFHNFGNTLMQKSINKLFNCNINDIMTGYRAFSYDFVKTFPVISRGFDVETEMSIHAACRRMKLKEIPIDYRDRPEGSVSKLNTISDGIKVIKKMIAMLQSYRPLLFFGIISTVLAVLSVIFFIPVWVEYLATGLVMRFPTMIICGFTMLAALLTLIAGIMLNNIRRMDADRFELHYMGVHTKKRMMNGK